MLFLRILRGLKETMECVVMRTEISSLILGFHFAFFQAVTNPHRIWCSKNLHRYFVMRLYIWTEEQFSPTYLLTPLLARQRVFQCWVFAQNPLSNRSSNRQCLASSQKVDMMKNTAAKWWQVNQNELSQKWNWADESCLSCQFCCWSKPHWKWWKMHMQELLLWGGPCNGKVKFGTWIWIVTAW